MEVLIIEPTEHTPGIDFNPDTGKLVLSGRSLPENAIEFYDPVFEWLDSYLKRAPQLTELHVDLDYLNSISHKMVLEILKNTRKVIEMGKNMHVKWYYEEEDEKMMEEGKAIASEFEIPIDLITKPASDGL
jgi:hypothetical protein